MLAQRYGHADTLPGLQKASPRACAGLRWETHSALMQDTEPACGEGERGASQGCSLRAAAGCCSFSPSWLSRSEICSCLQSHRNGTLERHQVPTMEPGAIPPCPEVPMRYSRAAMLRWVLPLQPCTSHCHPLRLIPSCPTAGRCHPSKKMTFQELVSRVSPH